MESKSAQENPSPKTERSQEEMAREYQRLKARHEWIQMNKKYMDQIRRNELLYNRLIFSVVVIHFIFSLLSFFYG